jgi:hypothetical protein
MTLWGPWVDEARIVRELPYRHTDRGAGHRALALVNGVRCLIEEVAEERRRLALRSELEPAHFVAAVLEILAKRKHESLLSSLGLVRLTASGGV